MDNLQSPDKDSKNIAAITHIAAIFFAFLAPLAVYILKSDDVFVKETAKECLNFAITVLLVYVVLGIIGISLMPLLWLVTVVLYVLAAKAATDGAIYRFPLTWRLLQ
jgi:uncharacterized Tic20 family protein